MKKSKFVLLMLLSVFVYSCEYDLSDDNFVEVTGPAPTDYQINLHAEKVSDNTIIANYRYLKVSSDFPHNLYKMTVTLTSPNQIISYPLQSEDVEGSYIYLPNFSYTSEYQMRIDIVALQPSGGSVAQQLTQEPVTTQTKTWKVLVRPKSTNLTINYRKTADGGLEIYWDKPDPNYGDVSYYSISGYSPQYFYNLVTQETSYKITNFTYGYVDVNVRAYFTYSNLEYWYGEIDTYINQ